MHKGRLEAFTDAVIAIILTVMVLELRPPGETSLRNLFEKPLGTELLVYVLSFVVLGIYWNNHHHLLQAAKKVTGAVLWANMHVLFWLSLVPFTTAWLGEHFPSCGPVMAYGVSLLGAAIGYYILCLTLVAANGPDSEVAQALGRDFKGKISVVFYLAGIAIANFSGYAACALYTCTSLMWLIPDRRFERRLNDDPPETAE